MSKLLDSVIEHIESLTPEQLEEEFKELEPYTHIGPSVEEYINYVKQHVNQKH